MRKSIAAAGAAGAAAAVYSLLEPYRFSLVTQQIPVPAGAPALRILHVSDSHLTGRDRARASFLTGLPDEVGPVPDLVLATGDMIEEDAGIDVLLEALAGFEAKLGLFYVLGSHDYYQARFKPPTQYFRKRRGPVKAPLSDLRRLEEGLADAGWKALTNRTEWVTTDEGARIRLAGVDDPYLRRHRTGHIERAANDDLAIGLMHAPEVISDYLLNGFDLTLAGHTHGGQVRFPVAGAVVTNSSLPTALAAGLHRVGNGWLYVTRGIGTSRFTRIRFLCPPEATLFELVPS